MKLEKVIKIKNICLSIIYAISFILFILTLSIGIVLLIRPIYYEMIHLYDLESFSGYSYYEIKYAFDSVMDYLVYYLPFSNGNLPYSNEGMSHFADCRVLFSLDFITLLISGIIFISLLIAKKFSLWHESKIYKTYGTLSLASIITFILIIIIAIFAISNFTLAFEVFHKIFFPNKTNWFFDYTTDPIINILPEEVFATYAVIIVIIFFILLILPLIKDSRALIKEKKNKKFESYNI